MKTISKNKKLGPYQTITTEQRKKVIDLVFTFNLPVKEAAKFVGIHPQTAKNFLAIYMKEGRIGKKQKREKHSHGQSFNSTCINLNRNQMEDQLEPHWMPQKNKDSEEKTTRKLIEIPAIRLSDQEKTMPMKFQNEQKSSNLLSLGNPALKQDNLTSQKILKDLKVVAWANQLAKTQEALKSIQLFNLLNNIQTAKNN